MDATFYKVNYMDTLTKPNPIPQVWQIKVEPHPQGWETVAYAGKEGGKMRRTSHGVFPQETDADFKANSKMKKKTDGGYLLSRTEAMNNPVFLPMLASATKGKPEVLENADYPVMVQRKFDGLRGLATFNPDGSIKFVSRKNNEYTIPIPKIRQEIAFMGGRLSNQLSDDIILDGELYVEPSDLDFNTANGLIRTSADSMDAEKERQQDLIKYRIYDFFDPQNPNLNYIQRHQILEDSLGPLGVQQFDKIVLTQNHIANNPQEVKDLALQFQKEGYEGGIVRQDMPYQVDKRNKALLKVKFFMDEEFQIVNFTDGDTPSSKGLVKWVVMTPEGKIFNVSMNAPHELQREYFQNGEKYIGSDLTVEFETYSPDGIPMKPRGKAIRNYE